VGARLLLKHRDEDCKFVHYWKRGCYLTSNNRPFGGSVVVEIGANRQSCEPSLLVVLKLVLEVVNSMVAEVVQPASGPMAR